MAQMWIGCFFHKFSVKWTIDTVAIGQKVYWAFIAVKKMMPACFIFTSWTVSWNAESKRDVLVAMPVTHIPHLKVTRDRWFELISIFNNELNSSYSFCPWIVSAIALHSAITPKNEDKYVMKVFNWSEVHLSKMTCYKIHTLGNNFKGLNST